MILAEKSGLIELDGYLLGARRERRGQHQEKHSHTLDFNIENFQASDNMGAERIGSSGVFFRSRIALAVGFGGLLSIMALAGIDALRVLGNFRRSDEQIRRLYLAQNHVLNDIRSDVYVSGTYVRDYLLEPEPQRAEIYRANLEDVRKHMESALDFYGRQATPAEVQHYLALRNE